MENVTNKALKLATTTLVGLELLLLWIILSNFCNYEANKT